VHERPLGIHNVAISLSLTNALGVKVKRHLKWLVVLFVVLTVLFILVIKLGRGDTLKNRKIAEDLLEFHRRWGTEPQPISIQNLTNLPFHDSVIYVSGRIFIARNHDLRVMHLDEYYYIANSSPNSSEWILYHGWTWNGHRLVTHKLLTIVETKTAREKVSQ
jgi:hypothetical protein